MPIESVKLFQFGGHTGSKAGDSALVVIAHEGGVSHGVIIDTGATNVWNGKESCPKDGPNRLESAVKSHVKRGTLTLVTTHFHEDHYDTSLLDGMQPDAHIFPALPGTRMVGGLGPGSHAVTIGGLDFYFYVPSPGKGSDKNDNCMAVHFFHGRLSYVGFGDMTKAAYARYTYGEEEDGADVEMIDAGAEPVRFGSMELEEDDENDGDYVEEEEEEEEQHEGILDERWEERPQWVNRDDIPLPEDGVNVVKYPHHGSYKDNYLDYFGDKNADLVVTDAERTDHRAYERDEAIAHRRPVTVSTEDAPTVDVLISGNTLAEVHETVRALFRTGWANVRHVYCVARTCDSRIAFCQTKRYVWDTTGNDRYRKFLNQIRICRDITIDSGTGVVCQVEPIVWKLKKNGDYGPDDVKPYKDPQ